MTTTRNDINHWLEEAQEQNCAFLIIGHDPFDNENFPCYCATEEAACEKLNSLLKNGNRYDEVYDMSMDIAAQLLERRAHHYPKSWKRKGGDHNG